MAKVIMKYEVTNYKEIEMEVPDEVYNNVVETKKALEDYVEKARMTANSWWESAEHNNYNHACDELQEYLDFDKPYNDDPWADDIYILGINTEDGEELIGW